MIALGVFSMASDVELDDWVPVLEPLEENSSLERHANVSLPEYIKKRENGEFDDIVDSWEERSNETVFYHTNRNASITTSWGPRKVVEDALIAEGFLEYKGDFQGDAVGNVEEGIARQHTAPYIDNISQLEAGLGGTTVEFSLPTDYDQEKWEDTVDTLVAAVAEFDQYQGELETISERYPR